MILRAGWNLLSRRELNYHLVVTLVNKHKVPSTSSEADGEGSKPTVVPESHMKPARFSDDEDGEADEQVTEYDNKFDEDVVGAMVRQQRPGRM